MATLVVQQTGGSYNTLQSALTAASFGDVISIEGAWTIADTVAATVPFAIVGLTIQTDATARHNGWNNPGDNHYRLEVADGNHALTINGTACTIDGLVVKQNSATISAEGIRVGVTGATKIKNTIVWTDKATEQQDGIYTATNATISLENVIAYGWYRGCINAQSVSSWDINSCTLYGLALDADGGCIANSNTAAIFNIYNTLAFRESGAVADCFNDSGVSATWSIDSCICDDGSISSQDLAAVDPFEYRTITDTLNPGIDDWVIVKDIVDIGTYDLRLQDNVSDNDAQEAHNNIAGSGLQIPDSDIQEETRNAPFDVGADVFITNEVTLTAEAGSVIVTGGNATLSAPTLSEGASTWHNGQWWRSPTYGSGKWYELTGSVTLTAEAGTIVVTGGSATLTSTDADVTLNAEAGSVVVTGGGAKLSVPLVAEAGIVTITGGSATLSIEFTSEKFIISTAGTFDNKGIQYGKDIAYNSSTDIGYTILSRVDVDSIELDGIFGTAPQPYQILTYVTETTVPACMIVEFKNGQWQLISNTPSGL